MDVTEISVTKTTVSTATFFSFLIFRGNRKPLNQGSPVESETSPVEELAGLSVHFSEPPSSLLMVVHEF